MKRTQSKRRVDNDSRIRRATVHSIAQIGIDRISMADIARRADLTTGALYGRFETLDDLVLDCWQNELSRTLFESLDALRQILLSDSPPISKESWPEISVNTTAALQLLVASRRNPILSEGLERELLEWGKKWDLHRESEPTARMRSSIATSLVLAKLLTPYLAIDQDIWLRMSQVIASALAVSRSEVMEYPDAGMVVTATGPDQLHCDLVNSTMDVIARSGFEGSSLSRIARRALCTTGAIYSRYESKSELVVDAIEILVASAARVSSRLVIEGASSHDLSTSVARMFHMALAHERQVWNNFRLEVYLAASWESSIRRCLRRVKQTSDERYFSLLQPTNLFSDDLISQIAIAGQFIPLGLSALSVITDGHKDVQYLEVSKNLMKLCGAS